MADDRWREAPPAEGAEDDGRAWRLIEKLVLASQSEQRKARRWGIFFKLLTFGYLFALLVLFGAGLREAGPLNPAAEHTALIEVDGVIAHGEAASADRVVEALRQAFDSERAVGILLRINSPGGSPVQAGYIYDELMRLKGLHPERPVYAVIGDIGASGAYYIAAAADAIYADKASLVGSIGVISSSFGFVEAMRDVGVERRLYTSGEHKAFLDPFSEVDVEGAAHWQSVLEHTHLQFIDAVRRGRRGRLKDSEDAQLFSGLIWNGEQALELGLVDGLASPGAVARDVVGEEEVVDYTVRPAPFERWVLGLAAQIKASVSPPGGPNMQLR